MKIGDFPEVVSLSQMTVELGMGPKEVGIIHGAGGGSVSADGENEMSATDFLDRSTHENGAKTVVRKRGERASLEGCCGGELPRHPRKSCKCGAEN